MCVAWFILGISQNNFGVVKIVIAKKWFKLRFYVVSQMLSKIGSVGCSSLSQVINSEMYISTGSLFNTCFNNCFIVAIPFLFTIIYVIFDYRYQDKYLLVNEIQANEGTQCLEEETIIKEAKYRDTIKEFDNEENECLMQLVQANIPTQAIPPVEKDTCWSKTKSVFTQMPLEFWLVVLISTTMQEVYGIFASFSTDFYMERYHLSYKRASEQSAFLGVISLVFVVMSGAFAEKYGKLG